MARRILLVLGIVTLVGAGCMGMSVSIAFYTLRPAGRTLAADLPVLLFGLGLYVVFPLAMGIIYLVCRAGIGRGGTAAAIVALVVAGLELLGMLVVGAGGLIVMTTGGLHEPNDFVAVGIPTAIALLLGAALGQLVYYLIRVLREPREVAAVPGGRA